MSFQNAGLPATPDIAKAQAKRLRTALAPDHMLGHSQALEVIARVHGEPSWGRLNSLISTSAPQHADKDENPQVAPVSRKQSAAGKTRAMREFG